MDALNEPSGLSDTSLKKSLGIYGRESLEERSEELGLQNTSTLSKEALQEEIAAKCCRLACFRGYTDMEAWRHGWVNDLDES
ncbi:MAG: hypothetical protein HFH23_17060 [Ruminococcus sp.]|nr:hypothetical protein [Ruminococcus sp.]